MSAVRFDRPVTVRVPGSTANLGPGFDALGMALNLVSTVQVTARRESGLRVQVSGPGAQELPTDETNLVVKGLLEGFAAVGAQPPGLELVCENGAPHSQGMGSSATALVAGLLAAGALLSDPEALNREAVVHLAGVQEGHADNVAASVLGGVVVSWFAGARYRAVRLEPAENLEVVACLPDLSVLTAKARAVLPQQVSHVDAAHNVGRAALGVVAFTRHPELLHAATEDVLHQPYRYPVMPATGALLGALRAAGVAAFLSGAGPAVLAVGPGPGVLAAVEGVLAGHAGAKHWSLLPVEVNRVGAVVER